MNNNTEKERLTQNKNGKRVAMVTLTTGCLTFLVAGAALSAGILLDARLGTSPRWTLILLAGSAPLTLGGVYLIVRRTLKRMKDEGKRENEEEGRE
ncbi:MAG: hypothetical protein ACOCYU_07500 [Brevefilum sp.]